MAKNKTTDEELEVLFGRKIRVNREAAAQIIKDFTETLTKCLKGNTMVHIRKLGTFSLKKRKGGRAKNLDGKVIQMPEYNMVRFSPSGGMKEAVNAEILGVKK